MHQVATTGWESNTTSRELPPGSSTKLPVHRKQFGFAITETNIERFYINHHLQGFPLEADNSLSVDISRRFQLSAFRRIFYDSSVMAFSSLYK